ncbi:hypothetical protein FGB62_76g0102 [Gracilaria domingensis]|nr:hypothetical protein FGB62_76g0102 [Gracilaria domingensis]
MVGISAGAANTMMYTTLSTEAVPELMERVFSQSAAGCGAADHLETAFNTRQIRERRGDGAGMRGGRESNTASAARCACLPRGHLLQQGQRGPKVAPTGPI